MKDKYRDLSIEEICNREEIRVCRFGMGEPDLGFYLHAFGIALIGVRTDLNVQETREVIAHELFHHFNKPLYTVVDRRCEEQAFIVFYRQRDELRADMFAAMLTCPDISDCGTVLEIMQKYDCSKATAKLRRKMEETRMGKGE